MPRRHGLRRPCISRIYSQTAKSSWEVLRSETQLQLQSELDSEMMGRGTHPLDFAKSELKRLQQILGLLPGDGLDATLQDAVFVCIDVEAFEDSQDKITEIGVAVLDTADINGLDPGENAGNWVAKMEHAHYRIFEHAKLVNRRFIKGCEDRFNYGTTTWINLVDASRVLNRVFADPIELRKAADFDFEIKDEGRNVIFVAHGLRNDKEYLGQLKFSLDDVKNITRTFDTQRVAGTKKTPVGLRRLLLSLALEPLNLHNAGNDAAYTLQSLIRMAFNDFNDPGVVFSSLEDMPKKLPPVVYSQTPAPHVWAGTTAKMVGDSANEGISQNAHFAVRQVESTATHRLDDTSFLPRKRTFDESTS